MAEVPFVDTAAACIKAPLPLKGFPEAFGLLLLGENVLGLHANPETLLIAAFLAVLSGGHGNVAATIRACVPASSVGLHCPPEKRI